MRLIGEAGCAKQQSVPDNSILFIFYLSSLVDDFGNNTATCTPGALTPPNNISRRIVDGSFSIISPHLCLHQKQLVIIMSNIVFIGVL